MTRSGSSTPGKFGKRDQITTHGNYAAWGGTHATLTANEDGSYRLTVYNVLAPSPHEFTVRLVLDGFEITLWVSNGEGDAPDTYTVLPPDGWVGLPAEITVEEKASGSIHIVPMLMG